MILVAVIATLSFYYLALFLKANKKEEPKVEPKKEEPKAEPKAELKKKTTTKKK